MKTFIFFFYLFFIPSSYAFDPCRSPKHHKIKYFLMDTRVELKSLNTTILVSADRPSMYFRLTSTLYYVFRSEGISPFNLGELKLTIYGQDLIFTAPWFHRKFSDTAKQRELHVDFIRSELDRLNSKSDLPFKDVYVIVEDGHSEMIKTLVDYGFQRGDKTQDGKVLYVYKREWRSDDQGGGNDGDVDGPRPLPSDPKGNKIDIPEDVYRLAL